MATVQLNGNLTIANSKTLSDEDKAKVLQAADGKEKVLRLPLLDADGNEVVLQGRLYESKNGSLTARFNCKLTKFEIVEVEEKKKQEQEEVTAESLAAELGLA